MKNAKKEWTVSRSFDGTHRLHDLLEKFTLSELDNSDISIYDESRTSVTPHNGGVTNA